MLESLIERVILMSINNLESFCNGDFHPDSSGSEIVRQSGKEVFSAAPKYCRAFLRE